MARPNDPFYHDQLCSPSAKNDVIMDDVQNIVREKTEPVASMLEQSHAILNKLAVGDDGRIQVGVQAMEQGEGFIQHVDRNVCPERARLMENSSGRLVQPSTSASSTKLVGRAFEQNMKVIWSWLMDDEVSTIGIYGMGGVGKTTILQHIRNELLERRDISHSVYWVNVPQGFKIEELQDLIAKCLHLDLSSKDDDLSRAVKLAKELAKKQKWILILDDLWNSFEPQEVGIPIPLKGCKLIITTRS
nr:probable disease resistance protein At5g43740 isoform X1 [Populus alba]